MMIPTLDFTAVEREDAGACEALRRAHRRVGACYLDVGGVPMATEFSELFDVASAFFSLPDETKKQVEIARSANFRGYVGVGEEFTNGAPDLKESFEFAKAAPAPERPTPPWIAVQDQLTANAGDHRRKRNAAEPSLLAGLLVDAHGERLTPSHAVKNSRRYRYYVSATLITEAAKEGMQSWRLAAQEIERCVIGILVDALTSPARLLEGLGTSGMPGDQMRRLLGRAARLAATLRTSPEERAKIVRELVEQVIVDGKGIIIKMRCSALLSGGVPPRASEEPTGSTTS
jgi:hypothetical protein